MAIKRAMYLPGFALCFFGLVAGCFAYDIKPCAQQASGKLRGSLNLVFCLLNYKDEADFARDRETLIRRLEITKPFDECNNFEFWYIDLSRKEECEVFQPISVFPPLKVRKDFLADISAKLKGVYKLIIIDAEGPVSCAELSSIDKLSLIILGKSRYKDKDSFAKGFLHELGHSLGLRDEYAGGSSPCSSGPPNCAAVKKEAQEWWGDLVGKDSRVNYFSGCCGNKDYIRPTVASLMNDPDKAEDFGPVNERYLRKALTAFRRNPPFKRKL